MIIKRILKVFAALFLAVNLVAMAQGWRASHLLPAMRPQSAWNRAILGPYVARKMPAAPPWPVEKYTVKGYAGLDLDVSVAPGSQGANAIILFHGYGEDKSQMTAMAAALKEHGDYTLLLPDFHAHGLSQGSMTSMGYYEAEDVLAVVNFTRQQFAPSKLAIYGLSMGGAAACRAISRFKLPVDALILDGVYDHFARTVTRRARQVGPIPGALAPLITFWIGATGGYNAFAVRPSEWARDISTPCLVMIGDADPSVSVKEAHRVWENMAGPREFVIFPSAIHAKLYQSDPEFWRDTVFEFLDKELKRP